LSVRIHELSHTIVASAVMTFACSRKKVACAAMPAASSAISTIVVVNSARGGIRKSPT
jgi:hypothetical protein